MESPRLGNWFHKWGGSVWVNVCVRLFQRNNSARLAEGCPFAGYAGKWARAKEKSHASDDLDFPCFMKPVRKGQAMPIYSRFSPQTASLLELLQDKPRVPDGPRPPVLETLPEKEAGYELSQWEPFEALLDILRSADLFHDERNEAWIRVREREQRLQFSLPGDGFRRWLGARYHGLCERTVPRDTIERVIEVLLPRALYQSPMHTLFNRFALAAPASVEPEQPMLPFSTAPRSLPAAAPSEPQPPNPRPEAAEPSAPRLVSDELPALWLDLNDRRGRAIRIGPRGWRVENDPPVLFRRFRHQHEQPLPEAGVVSELFELLPLAHESERLLLLAWLTMAAYPFRPCPMLCLYGPQGAAKTTTARMLRELLDPSTSDNFDFQTQYAHLPEILDHHAVPVFDNVGRLKPSQANLLCRAVTGGSWSKRKLYTDSEDIVFRFRRPLILTALEIPCAAADWLDRALLLPLESLLPERRRDEHGLWHEFNRLRPRLLGGLCGAIAAAMRHWPQTRRETLPRMADFARWGAAVAISQGKTGADFLRLLQQNRLRQSHEIIACDPIADALVGFMQKTREFCDTPSRLLETLNQNFTGPRGKNWPANASWLIRKLHGLENALHDHHIELRFSRQNEARLIEMRYLSEVEVTA